MFDDDFNFQHKNQPEKKLGLIFDVISFSAGIIVAMLLAAAVSVALLVLLELVEERISLAQRVTKYAICVVFVNYILLIVGGFPIMESSWSILSHVVYSVTLSYFPSLKAFSIGPIISAILCIVTNLLWFHYLRDSSADFIQIIGFFFIQVWLVPLILMGSVILASMNIPF